MKFETSKVLSLAALVVMVAVASPLVGAGAKKVRFVPRFEAGETLRYHIESRTTTTGKATEPIENPQGSSQLKQAADLVVKLEVLKVDSIGASTTPASAKGTTAKSKAAATGAHAGAGAAGGDATAFGARIRMRATYEKSSAKTESDGYDPAAASMEDQYNHLEGRSLEFTVEPDGRLTEMKGIEDVLANPSAEAAARSWMNGIASGAGFPKEGVVPGQKWSNERPMEGTVLAGLIWRTESTYLRDEACSGGAAAAAVGAAAGSGSASAGAPELCAVILTRFEILRRGPKDEQTPEDYRKNGLRTSGTWTGSGQSLDSISLATGLLMNSTQTSTQEMNLNIVSATSGSKIHYAGRVESESEIALLPQEKSDAQ